MTVLTRPSGSSSSSATLCHTSRRRRVRHATPPYGDAGERGHVAVEGGEVVDAELREVVVAARAGEHLHELDVARRKRASRCDASSTGQPRAQVRLLRRDADRAVVGVARAHAEAADRLDRAVGDRHRVGAERERLGEVGRVAQAAGDHERDVAAAALVEVAPGAGQRGDRRHRDVVAEQQRRRAGAAAAAVEDDVVDADLERGVDVGLDVLGRELGADRDAARALAHLVGEAAEVVDAVPVGERRRRHRRGALGQPAHLGDAARPPSGRAGARRCRSWRPGRA